MSDFVQLKTSPYRYHGMTVSVCPTCLASLPASLHERDNKMYMSKVCPDHGRFRTVVAADAAWYKDALSQQSPSLLVKKHQTETTHKGCPHDCGVCPEHEQANALPVIEITDVCNLECPVCYADNLGNYYMTPEEMKVCLDTLEESGSRVDAIVLVGGEPTAHPKLIELIDQCYERDFVSRVVVATNGILVGRRPKLAEALKRAGAYILFQLDSIDPNKNEFMRGTDMVSQREQALGMLREFDIDTTLMMVVIKGLNDDEVGALVKYAVEDDFLTGIDIATMAYSGAGGSKMSFSPMDRMTGTDLLTQVVDQTDFLERSDFLPMLAPHPQCGTVSYILRLDDGSSVPLLRISDREVYRQAMTNEYIVVPDERHEAYIQHMIEHVWTHADELPNADVILETLKRGSDEIYPSCGDVPTSRERMRKVERFVKNIYLHNYMDAYSLDAGVLRKCACMQVLPDGRMIPDCSYRVIHRATDKRFTQPRAAALTSHGNDGLRHKLVKLSKKPA